MQDRNAEKNKLIRYGSKNKAARLFPFKAQALCSSEKARRDVGRKQPLVCRMRGRNFNEPSQCIA